MDNQEIVQTLDFRPARLKYPYAWAGHLPFAYYLVSKMAPKTIVELGSHRGNSLCTFGQSVADHEHSTRIVGIDLWSGDPHAGFYDSDVYGELKAYAESVLPCVEMMRTSFEEAVANFDDASIDILHIDGYHTYEAAKGDFDTWKSKVKEDGVVLMHDIEVKRGDFGVYKFWEELKDKYRTISFPHSHGLGVVFMPESLSRSELRHLLNDYEGEQLLFKAFITAGNALRFQAEARSDESQIIRARKISARMLARHTPIKRLVKALAFKLTGKT